MAMSIAPAINESDAHQMIAAETSGQGTITLQVMDFPREIRDLIWEHGVAAHISDYVVIKRPGSGSQYYERDLRNPLYHVSKAVREESLKITVLKMPIAIDSGKDLSWFEDKIANKITPALTLHTQVRSLTFFEFDGHGIAS